MASKGGQLGNNNPARGKLWNDALRKAITQEDGKRLRRAAEQLLDKAAEGEAWAIKELADRLDGKAFQQIELSGDPENPLSVKGELNVSVLSTSALAEIMQAKDAADKA